MGLKFRSVLADSGAIGGSLSQEFHVLADSGEDAIAYCETSGYAANVETAQSMQPEIKRKTPSQDLSKAHTPNIRSVSEQAKFMGLKKEQILKTLLVKGSQDDVVALLLRGDDDLNTIKAEKHDLVYSPLTLVDEQTVQNTCQCRPGFVGPMNLNIPIIADHHVLNMSDFSCGANEDDQHFVGVNWERDLPLPKFTADLRTVRSGDMSVDGKGTLEICRGIEVGHIFQLGNKYSQSMQATVLNEKGQRSAPEMGCYGIGVTRIVAAAIEQNHDQSGIIWPEPMAPFSVVLIPMNYHKSHRVRDQVATLYDAFQAAGIEILLDDRQERPGRMFAEADLIGIPHRLVLGERGIDEGKIEYKHRKDGESQKVAIDSIVSFIKEKTA